MFFKTVRSDGTSVYAHGKLARKYEVGKRYRFPEQCPAHVFTFPGTTKLDSDMIYNCRAEEQGGNRVLICYGELEERCVPCFDIYSSWWNFSMEDVPMERRHCSTDFVVIGEIALPESYNGIPPAEKFKPQDDGAVVFSKVLKAEFTKLTKTL